MLASLELLPTAMTSDALDEAKNFFQNSDAFTLASAFSLSTSPKGEKRAVTFFE